jgi:iron complex outermembrane receptor protein
MFKHNVISAAVLVGLASITSGALAQQQLERVEITGSHIKRVAKEGALPVEVLSSEDIRVSGAKTVLELMRQVSALGADGYNDTPTQNGFSKGVATASLRSLSATSTLILLNGRRMAPSAYANPNNGTSTLYDLNSIPISALDRVEVLKDGASAVYGSDAVGGVINFITKNNYRGYEVAASAGANDDGQFAKRNVNLTGGFGDLATKGWSLLLSADFTQKGRTTIRDGSNDIQADDYRAINLRLNPYNSSISQLPFFTKESKAGSLSFPQTGATARVVNVTAGCDPAQLITGAAVHGISTAPLLGRTFCNYDVDQFSDAQTKSEDANFLGRGVLQVTPNVQAYGELAITQSKRHFRDAARSTSGVSGATTNFLVGGLAQSFRAILEVGHPDNPFNNDPVPGRAAVSIRFADYPVNTELVNTSSRALVGAKGVWGNWDWDTGLLWNRSEREETRTGFPYLPTLRQILGPSGKSLASVISDPNFTHPIVSNNKSEIAQFDFKIGTEFGKLAGGAVGFAVGAEIRRETIVLVPDPDHAAGNILGLATTAIDGGRTVKSAFTEMRLPFFKSFSVELAGRYDKYPGLKSSFVPKVGAKWTPLDELGFRTSFGKGFRAPAVSQVTPGGAQFFLNGLHDPLRCQEDGVNPKPGAEAADCNKSVSGVGGPNPDLKPEKSKSWTFGVLLSPTKGLDLSVDWWKIRKVGEVALGSAQDALDHPDRFAPGTIVRDTNPNLLLNGVPGTGPLVSVATPWMNQGSTEVSGLDFDAKLRVPVAEGVTFNASAKLTYNLKYLREEVDGYPTFNVVGTNGGLADWATSVGDIPRTKGRLSAGFVLPQHVINLSMNHVSSVKQLRLYDGSNDPASVYSGDTCHWGGTNFDNVGGRTVLGVAPTATNGRDLYVNRYPSCTVPKWVTFDLNYTYSGFKNLDLSLNIQNFTDEKAPYQPASNTSSTVIDGYNSGLHNNPGRYWTISARYKF